MKKILFVVLFAFTTHFTVPFASQAQAEILLLDQNNWKVQMTGFVEGDAISDSTQSFREIIGNTPVQTSGTQAGANGRFQTSIRNSRLNFTLTPPQVGEWRTKAVLEFDLFGFDPNTGANANNSEANFNNNPTFRPRHAYFKSENDGWEILVGQTWELFGWQSYYFTPSVSVAPLPALVFVRTAQVRGTKNWDLGAGILTSSIAVVRPPQADANMPDLQAGLRFAFCCRGSGYMMGGAAPRKVEPMSVALSGTVRKISVASNDGLATDMTNYTGAAVGANIFIPILAATEKNISNTLSLTASFTQGAGYGDQFNSFTGGSATNSVAAPTNLNGRLTKVPNLDAGIGDYDASNNFNLVQLTSYNVNLQYNFPNEMPDWMSAGFGVLSSNNMDSLVGTNGTTSAGGMPYDRERVYYANYFHEFTSQIRLGAEYDYIDTQYKGGAVVANDIRYQLSGYFMF